MVILDIGILSYYRKLGICEKNLNMKVERQQEGRESIEHGEQMDRTNGIILPEQSSV